MGATPGPRWIIGERVSLVDPGLELCLAQEAAGVGASVFLLQQATPGPETAQALAEYTREYEKLDDPSLPAIIEAPTPQSPRLVLEAASGPSLPDIADDPQGVSEGWVLEACRQVLSAFHGLYESGWRHDLLGPEFCRVRNEQSSGETDLRILLSPPLHFPDPLGTAVFSQLDRSSLARTLRCLANIASAIQVVTKPLPGDINPLPPTGQDIAGAIRSLARRLEGGVTGGEPLSPGQALSEIRQLIRGQHQLRVNPSAKPPSLPADPYLDEDPEEIDQETSQLLAQIVRKEMLDQKNGNWFQRLNRHPAFVIPAFILVIGALIYLLWPISADELYHRGSVLMDSEDKEDWTKGWDLYLEPLAKKYPEQAERERMAEFRGKIEVLRRGRISGREAKDFRSLSESHRLFLEGVHLYQMGSPKKAKAHWENFVKAYEKVPEASGWVDLAKEGIKEELLFQKKEKGKTEEKVPPDFLGALHTVIEEKKKGMDSQYKPRLEALKSLYKNDPEAMDRIDSLLGKEK